VLIVACLTFLAAFASLAQAYEYKQQCKQQEQVVQQQYWYRRWYKQEVPVGGQHV